MSVAVNSPIIYLYLEETNPFSCLSLPRAFFMDGINYPLCIEINLF